MRRIVLISLMLLAGCDQATEPHFGESPAIVTIAELKSLCEKDSYLIVKQVDICGNITANDLYGEMNQQIVIEDDSGAISVALSGSNLSDHYPVGNTVTVHGNGLTLYNYGGKIELGTTPDEYGVGRLNEDQAAQHLASTAAKSDRRCPTLLTISQIGQRYIDCYVRLDNVHFLQNANWCDEDETGKAVTTEHKIADNQGYTFTVRTLGGCEYAKEPVPMGTGSICGVIDYFAGKYTLRVINREIKFTVAESPTVYPSIAGCSDPTPTK